MKNRKDIDRRKKAAIVAVVAAILLVITGTLAWQAISQRAVNNVAGELGAAGARLHDDFGLEDVPDFTQPLNKDVYVENYSGQNPENASATGEPVFVRVKLLEYMEMGEGAGLFQLPSGTGTDPGTDPVDYQDLDQAGANGARIADPANKATSLVPTASIINLKSWIVHVEDDTANPFLPYWTWTMGGSKAFMPTFNKDNTSLLTDRTDYAHTEFTAGTSKMTDTASYANPAYDMNSEEHTAKDTLATAGIVSMAEWKALGTPVETDGKGYWVGDTDGWYYWSKSLMPGDATALLLDQISMNGGIEGEFYYGIHVISEMATAGDWGDEDDETGFYEDGLTEDGLLLLDQAEDQLPDPDGETYDLQITQVNGTGAGTNTVKQGGSISFDPVVTVTNEENVTVDATDQTVKWELSGAEAAGTVLSETGYTANNITLTVDAAETVGANELTLTATSQAGQIVKQINLTVTALGGISTPVGGEYTDKKGIVWLVLAEENGAKLLMTKYVYGYQMRYHSSNNWLNLDSSDSLKPALVAFYQGAGSDIHDAALAYASQPINDARDAYDDATPAYDPATTDAAGLSHPGANPASAEGQNAIFVLSMSEVNTYPTVNKVAIDTGGTAREWWLRSPGGSSTYTASVVRPDGVVDFGDASGSWRGYRPAVWVNG